MPAAVEKIARRLSGIQAHQPLLPRPVAHRRESCQRGKYQLLIVGGGDLQVIHLNKQAFDRLRCEKRLEIVPGASHLFEEPGALDRVAVLARQWFQLHLAGRTMPAGG